MLLAKQKTKLTPVFGSALLLVFCLVAFLFLNNYHAQAAAGINERLNFQGRLYNAAGAVIDDGDYNMEFEIVQDGDGCNPTSGTYPCSGTVQWTETRTGADVVTVRNGYFSVELGSVTSLPTGIWNQDTLWLSVNIGGTGGAPSWDGEMKPLKRLTSSPYALNAARLGGLSSTDFLQIAQGVQLDTSTIDPSIFINKDNASGTPNILQLQKAGTDVFTVDNSGLVTAGAGLTVASGTQFTVGGEAFTDLTGNGLTIASNALTVNVATSADGLSSTTSSGSGLEVLASGVTLLQGCGDGQVLEWNETSDEWACASVAAGSNDLDDVYLADSDKHLTVNSASGLTFDLTSTGDFAIEDNGTTAFLVNDSGQVIVGSGSAASALNLSGAGSANGLTFNTDGDAVSVYYDSGTQEFRMSGALYVRTPSLAFFGSTGYLGASVSGTGIVVSGELDLGTNVINNIGNASTDFTAAGGLTLAGLLTPNGGISIGSNNLTGTTGNIDYTNFDVAGTTGNTDIGGTITAGSSNVAITNSTGNVLHDSLEDCTDGQVLKWTTGGSRWGCGADNASSMDSRSFVDSTSDATSATNTVTYWDTAAENNNSYPNITPSSTSSAVYGTVTIAWQSNANNSMGITARVERTSGGSVAACNSGTALSPKPGTASATSDSFVTTTSTFLYTPGTTTQQWFNVCADSATTNTNSTLLEIRVTLFEVTNSNADLAELYSTSDATLQVGEVVSLDSGITNGVKRTTSAYERGTVGIISTAPALLIGGQDDGVTAVPVALAGRVPVKVSGENGPIAPGDLLTSSSIPGVAMKATKAGPIVGKAMTAFDGSGIGMVTMFVQSGESNGSGMLDLMPGLAGADPAELSRLVLAQLLAGNAKKPTINMSEITTDRIVAGLEIVTPSITSDVIALNTLEVATGESIRIDGDVVVHGTLTADKIRANQIEGLAIFTDRLQNLESRLDDGQGWPSNNTGVLGDNVVNTTGETALGSVDFQNIHAALDMSVDGSLRVAGGLSVGGPAEFHGNAFFFRLVQFVDKVIFDKEVTFKDTVTYNSDSGGFATIHATQQEVVVEFDKPYANVPVVTVNVRDGQFVNYSYKDLTPTGFTIVLEKAAVQDVEFVWTALSVENAQTHEKPVQPTLQPTN